MKKVLIRNGVFETNSSSAHSVSLAGPDKDFVLDTIYPDENGSIILTGGEFGWEWFKHNDALTKANYAAIANMNNLNLIKEVIMEQTGCDKVIFAFSNDYDSPNWSYIDHQSIESETCPSSKDELRNFIFNKNSWLFGGNDNVTAAPNFYDVPTIKSDGTIIEIGYKYQLYIDGSADTAKFINMPNEEELINAFNGLFESVVLERNGKFTKMNGWSSLDDNYEFISWKRKPDFDKKIVYFIHRNNINKFSTRLFEERFGREYNYGNDYKLLREIEEELYKSNDPDFVVGINFKLYEIQ